MYEADEYDDPDYTEYTPTTSHAAKNGAKRSSLPGAVVAAGKKDCCVFSCEFVLYIFMMGSAKV